MRQTKITARFILLFILISILLISTNSTALDKESYYSTKRTEIQSKTLSDPVEDPFIDWPLFHAIQQTGMIDAGFDCFGRFGRNFENDSHNPWGDLNNSGFVTPSGSSKDYLFSGAIWIGSVVGRDTLVSTTTDGWSSNYEFKPSTFPDSGNLYRSYSISDFSIHSSCIDTFPAQTDYFGRPHRPLFIEIRNRGHVFRSDTLDNIVFYDILFTNKGINTLENTYIGFFHDCDVGDLNGPSAATIYNDDLSGSFQQLGVGYAIDNDGDPLGYPEDFNEYSVQKIFASKLLASSVPITQKNYNWWVSNGNPSLDFGPRRRGTPSDPFRYFGTGGLGTPEGDANKYYIMRHVEWDYDQFQISSIGQNDTTWIPPNPDLAHTWAVGHDTRYLMSYGPFEILPDSSIRLLYINFTADSVHINPDNLSNLPGYPNQYFSNLQFDDLMVTLSAAESMINSFFNPLSPVSGLKVVKANQDSTYIEWDQWEAPYGKEIDGFELYLTKIDSSLFPYQGTVPPWLKPVTPTTEASLGKKTKYVIPSTPSDGFYFFNVAHRSLNGIGDIGKPIVLGQERRDFAPSLKHEFAFFNKDSSIQLEWIPPEDVDINHYNIYKFNSIDEYNQRYLPFYDQGNNNSWQVPIDSFQVDNEMYYYYQMEKHAVIDGTDTTFIDSAPTDSSYYVITAVNDYGLESFFSPVIDAVETSIVEKQILVILNSYISNQPYITSIEQKKSFYSSILQDYDFDIYSLFDSILINNCDNDNPVDVNNCFGIKDLSKYSTVIIDDDWRDEIIGNTETINKSFTKFILNNGKLINFGTLAGIERNVFSSEFNKPVTSDFVLRFFGIESISYYSFVQNITQTTPAIDTLYAISLAEPVDFLTPALHLDTTIDFLSGFSGPWESLWPDNSPPNVATFELDLRGELMHNFHSQYPQSSIFEGLPIGIKTITDISKTYLFGFHLFYMKQSDAKQLIDFIVRDIAFTAQPVALPEYDTIYTFWANSVNPTPLTIQIGQLGEKHVNELDITLIRINQTITPITTSVVPPPDSYFGDFLELTVPMNEFINSYGVLSGTVDTTFIVSANFINGEQIEIIGQVLFRGHVFGDINGDNSTDITDLVVFVQYLFQNNSSSIVLLNSDLTEDGNVDISDLLALVAYMFQQ